VDLPPCFVALLLAAVAWAIVATALWRRAVDKRRQEREAFLKQLEDK